MCQRSMRHGQTGTAIRGPSPSRERPPRQRPQVRLRRRPRPRPSSQMRSGRSVCSSFAISCMQAAEIERGGFVPPNAQTPPSVVTTCTPMGRPFEKTRGANFSAATWPASHRLLRSLNPRQRGVCPQTSWLISKCSKGPTRSRACCQDTGS